LKQGSILLVHVAHPAGAAQNLVAHLGSKSSPMFQQPDGSAEALFGLSVDTPVGSHLLTITNKAGAMLAEENLTVVDGQFPRQNITVGKTTAGLQPLPGELEAVQALKDVMTPIRYWEKPLMSPTQDCENSLFGVKRYHNGVYIHDYHKGVDLRAPFGRPIHAIAGGVVQIAAPQFRLHGGTVGLDHGQGLSSIYIHMSKVAVKVGQHVQKGDVIGYVGSTGFATGPHLHWGLYANGVPVNPDQWIPVAHCL
jgi:murein DD-endopeptidase MepM/ murein hydrolase activator NlpD